MKTKADYIEKLNREISKKLHDLHEVFGVDLDTVLDTVRKTVLDMRVEEIERERE